MDSTRSPELNESCSPRSLPMAAASPSPEHMDKGSASIRFLISNAAAGSVIGKGGVTINEFQSQSGARIQLSRNHEYFPGTSDRIIALSGTIKEVLTAFHLILSKILSEAEKDTGQDTKSNQVRLIVPNAVCGAIIGKGGATIKSFVEDSNASIKLSPLEQSIPGVNDRIVTIIGNLDQQLRAVALVVSKLAEDPNYTQFASTSLSYTAFPAMGYGGSPYLRNGVNGNYRMKGVIPPVVGIQTPPSTVPVLPGGPGMTSVTLAIPDEHVGAIVGRGGKIITEIQQSSGSRIKISDRGDYVPGTTNRKVTITGSAEGVRQAQQMVTQRVHQNTTSDSESLQVMCVVCEICAFDNCPRILSTLGSVNRIPGTGTLPSLLSSFSMLFSLLIWRLCHTPVSTGLLSTVSKSRSQVVIYASRDPFPPTGDQWP